MGKVRSQLALSRVVAWPDSYAHTTACTRWRSPSFRNTRATCVFDWRARSGSSCNCNRAPPAWMIMTLTVWATCPGVRYRSEHALQRWRRIRSHSGQLWLGLRDRGTPNCDGWTRARRAKNHPGRIIGPHRRCPGQRCQCRTKMRQLLRQVGKPLIFEEPHGMTHGSPGVTIDRAANTI
jgi:hypothetical protein